jgi:hypothetical protein
MTVLTQKWCLITLLEDTKVGYKFTMGNWPLHITFAGVHDADWNNPTVFNGLKRILSDHEPFQAKALHIGNLGPNDKPTKVTFIEMNEEVIMLHSELIRFLEKNNARFNKPEFNGDGFIAHSTVQKHQQIKPDETVAINNIALINMFPDGDGKSREVVNIISLG